MGFSDIIKTFDNAAARADAQKSFAKARDAWFTYVGGLKCFGVLLEHTPVAAMQLACTIAARAKFCGKIYLIGVGDGLREHLAFFKSSGEFAYNDGTLSCKMELVKSPPADLDLLVSRSGDRQSAEKLTCKHYFQVESFGSNDMSFTQYTAMTEPPQRVTYYFDHMLRERLFRLLPIYRDPAALKQLPPPIKSYWSGAFAKAAACEKAVSLCESALVLPVEYGGEAPILLLGLAVLRVLPTDKAVVLVDFSGAPCTILRMFAEKKPDQWLELLCDQFPTATREQLQKALIPPLSKLHSQLGSKLSSIHFPKDLATENVQPGHLYICAIKDVPADYRDIIYANAKLPAVLAKAESACVSISAGLPYLCTEENAYPVIHGAAGAKRLIALARPLANHISLYLNAADMELDGETAALSTFLQEVLSDADTDAIRYCKTCGTFVKNEQNRRLDQSAAIAYTYTIDDTQQRMAQARDGHAELETLYNKLVAGIKDNKLVLSNILPDSRGARYLNTLAGGEGVLALEANAKDVVRIYCEQEHETDPKEIISVNVWNVKTRLGGTDFTAMLCFSGGGDSGPLMTTFAGAVVGAFQLDGMPWLRLENIEFSLTISEDGSIPTIQFGVDVKDTGLHLLLTLGAGSSLRLQGSFSTPVTAMDAYFALAGGVDFTKAMPAELQTLTGIGLESVVFQLDGQNMAVTCMEFNLTTKDVWTLWEQDGKPLVTLRPRLEITVTSPQDLQNRTVSLMLSGDCAFGEDGKAGALRLAGRYPPFTASMSLLSTLKLGEILRMFGVDSGFDADVTTLEIFAKPSDSYYMLQAVVEGEWALCDQFSVTGLGLELISAKKGVSVSFSGLMLVCTVQVGVSVRWRTGGGWDLLAMLSAGGGLSMSDLVRTYGGNNVVLPACDENDPILGSLTVRYSTAEKDWSISAKVQDWYISFLQMTVSASATVARKKKELSCSLDATLSWNGIELAVGYSYVQGKNSFYFSWNSFSASISDGIGKLTLRNFSLGSMVETMVGWVTGVPFGLEAPWDLLSSIKLATFTLTYNFNNGDVSMEVEAPLDLGFAQVRSVKLAYVSDPSNAKKRQAQVTLTGSFPWNTGEDALGDAGALGPWDAATPGAAPVPDGKGNAYFDLRMMALGQRVGLLSPVPLTVDDAITRLNQYDPEIIPAYDASAGWLVASDFGILRDKKSGQYLLNAKLIFCDPSLFALRITCDSAAAKIFKGLSFDILYCKISDTIGLYKACITLPNRMRFFDIGAYSLTLPCFSIEIYTNGDFKLDVGFPYKGDFTRSFSISGQIGIIPFVGAAGFYFGKLSSATAESSGIYLPKTTDGLFNPAIVFGIGLRFGIGKRLDAGILKAGFSITFSAIIEGVFAKFNPYGDKPVEWYYALTGAAGIQGEIFGSIDFVIISASVHLRLGVEVSFALVAYRAATFTVSAYIEASASLTINLGLFKIKLSFSFTFHVSASFTIGKDTLAPWDSNSLPAYCERIAQIHVLDFSHFKPSSKHSLDAQLSLPLTVAADEWGSDESKVCAVALMTVSLAAFDTLAERAVCWAVAAGLSSPISEAELRRRTVDAAFLEELEALLAVGTSVVWADADRFLTDCFTVEVAGKKLADRDGELDGVLFPIPPALSLTLEDAGKILYCYQLDDFSGVSAEALEEMRKEFDRLAVEVEKSTNRSEHRFQNAPEISMARWLLVDYVRLLARQAVKHLRVQAEKDAKPLGELLSALKETDVWRQLGGMVSRYQLHGLRIPTKGITARATGGWSADGKFPPELGIWSLCGAELPVTQNSRVLFHKGALACGWLRLPNDYTVAVDASLADGLLKLAKKGFSPPMTITTDVPTRIPYSISFGRHLTLDGQTVWNVPEGLSRDAGPFALELLSAKQQDGFQLRRTAVEGFQTAALIEFTVKKTPTPNVFMIAGASERHAALLSHVIASRPLVTECRLVGSVCHLLRVMQMDLSTETHPPFVDGANSLWFDFLKTLWEAFVTNNGGYILAARPTQPFPDTLFNDRGEGVFTLVVVYDAVPVESPAVNAVLYNGAVGEDAILTALSKTQSSFVAPSAESTPCYINAQWNVGRSKPGANAYANPAEELLDSSYTLLRYGVKASGGFSASGGSMPAGPDKDWQYSFTLPVDTYLGGADYTAAGKRLEVWLEWLDLYGNHLPAPTQYRIDCGYMDELLGLSRYPGVTAQWSVLPTRGLCIALSFDLEACRQQASAPASYRRIAAQLSDPNGVDLCLISPLFSAPMAFSPGQCVQLQAWVDAIRQTIAGAAQAPSELVFSFPLGSLSAEQKLFALTCAVRLTRRGAPAKGFEQVDGVHEVTSEISMPTDVKQFAADLEATLDTLRVLKGRDQLFALRADLVHMQFEQKSPPVVFAPKPISNTLRAESEIALYHYETGKGLSPGGSQSYTGVDLNIWMKNALAIIDAAFTPEVAGAAAALEQVQPDVIGYAAMLTAKKTIAAQLAELLTPVFAQQTAKGLETARETFRQRLLSHLSNLYNVRAVVLATAHVAGSIENARFYGGVTARTTAHGMTLSPTKVAVRNGSVDCAFSISGSDLVRGESGEIIPYADFDLTCGATHLETEIQTLIDGFESSAWLQGVTKPILTADMGRISVAFPLYTFPEIPVMQDHAQMPAGDDSCCTYRYTYTNSVHYPQRMPHVTVRYKLPGAAQTRRNGNDSMFTVLARLDAIGSAVLEDITAAAKRINATDALPDPASADAVVFAAAMQSLLKLTQELASAPLSCARNTNADGEQIRFALTEGSRAGALTVTVCADRLSQAEAQAIVPHVGLDGYTPTLVSSGTEGFTYQFEDEKKTPLPSMQGQLVKERTLSLPPRKILVYRNAMAEMYVQQNRILVPGQETAPEFVFTTGTVAFSAPAVATATVTERKDIRAYLPKEQTDTLANCLSGLFATYIGEAKSVTIQVECRYLRTIGSNQPVETEQPIFLQTPIVIQNGDTQAMVRDWVKSVHAWRLEFPPDRRVWLGTEGLHFDIAFTDAGNPVLSLKNCLYFNKPVIE